MALPQQCRISRRSAAASGARNLAARWRRLRMGGGRSRDDACRALSPRQRTRHRQVAHSRCSVLETGCGGGTRSTRRLTCSARQNNVVFLPFSYPSRPLRSVRNDKQTSQIYGMFRAHPKTRQDTAQRTAFKLKARALTISRLRNHALAKRETDGRETSCCIPPAI